jgi:iron complex outermembrane recepter protein
MGVRSRHCSGDIASAVSAVLRALSVCVPAALLEGAIAPVQAAETAGLGAAIPAQPLAKALATFASQSGLQLVYVSSLMHNQTSHEVPAGLGFEEALTRMLQGTGLRFEYLTPHSVRILAAAPAAHAPGLARPEEEMREVIISANRREEYLQDVPITAQVLTGEQLARLSATTFDDYVTYLPNVTAHGVGPAQNNIYIRGLATSVHALQGAGFDGSFPNVALYLDEQSVQLPFRNLDLYVADLNRIEVLEGPQGTLFGAGAQAGVVRYITNKPQLHATEAAANLGYATTAHGDPSTAVDAMLNLALIPGTLAVRAVIYNERRGGYIDNIPATFARADTDLSIHYANYPIGCGGGGAPCQVPPNAPIINNSNLAAPAVNPVTYKGARLSALYQFNDDWSALLSQSYQGMEADGVFAEMAADSLGVPQPDLTVQLFNSAYDKDRFENTALTIEGRLGALKLLYAGAYLVRNVDQVADYTSYARALYADYYQCLNPGSTSATAQCFTPSSVWHAQLRNTHLSQELRLTTPADWRLRGVGGLFYEDYRIQEQDDWLYVSALPYFSPIGPPTGYYTVNGSQTLPNGLSVQYNTPGAVFVSSPVTSNNPNVRPPGDGFFNDITRGYTQNAAYLSVDFDLLPNKLTLTGGTRYSSIRTSVTGSAVGSFGCLILAAQVPDPCVNHSNTNNLSAQNLSQTFSGFTSRADLSWKISDEALLFYTWSQGFRAGGFNRGVIQVGSSPLSPGPNPWQATAREHRGWQAPIGYAPDNLTNNELGWKTMWLNHRIEWNGTLYQEDWDQVQIGAFSGGATSGVQTTINGGSYRVRGFETFAVVRVTSGLSLEAGASWNHSELLEEATFLWRDGTPINFGELQTAHGQPFANPTGTRGSPLAGAPAFQGNCRVRYDFALNGYDAFAQAGAVHQSQSLASTDNLTLDLQGNSIGYVLPPFTTYDAAVGVGREGWLVQLYGENLTDTRAQLYANYAQWYKAVTVNRPRTIGIRYSLRFAQPR